MDREPKQRKSAAGKSPLSILLLLVAVLFTLSSGMLGFVLGRNASNSQGELVDTIVISPDRGLASGGEATHFLSGRVVYAQGKPCAGATVRLAEEGKTDETDENGKFFFSDIHGGSTTVEVLDSDGALLADTPVTFQFMEGGNAKADVTVPVFELPTDARMVELTLTVDPDKGSLAFQEDAGYVVTTSGDVLDFSGGMLQNGSSSYSVIPGGDVVSSTGYAAIPSHQIMILPTGEVSPVEELTGEEEEQAGMEVQESGSVILHNQVTVEPNGLVKLPGKEEPVGPAEAVISVTEGEAEEMPQLPDIPQTETPSGEGPAVSEETAPPGSAVSSEEPSSSSQIVPTASAVPKEETPDGDVQSQAEEPAANTAPNPLSEPTPAPTPTPTPTPTPSPTPSPTPDALGVNHLELDTDSGEWIVGKSWKQQSMVDLFKNRTSGAELGEVDGVPVIAPGSKGYYEFNLENSADYNIRFVLSISEGSFHLPILYSVRDMETGWVYKGGSKVNEDGSAISTEAILLPAKSQRRYRLGWEWQYEDWLYPDEDDAYDTAATREADGTYIVSVNITAEEVYMHTHAGSGTRVPGKKKY